MELIVIGGLAFLAFLALRQQPTAPTAPAISSAVAPQSPYSGNLVIMPSRAPVGIVADAPVPIAIQTQNFPAPAFLGPPIPAPMPSSVAVASAAPPAYTSLYSTATASGVPISSLAQTSQGNTLFGSLPAQSSVSVLPVSSQVFSIWPQTAPSDWYLIGPSQTSLGNYAWGNHNLGVRTNVSPNGQAAFGGETL